MEFEGINSAISFLFVRRSKICLLGYFSKTLICRPILGDGAKRLTSLRN